MFFLFGEKEESEVLGLADAVCPECGRVGVAMLRGENKLTIYFIPTVSLGQSYTLKCPHCRKTWDISTAEAERLKQTLKPVPTGWSAPAAAGSTPTAQPRGTGTGDVRRPTRTPSAASGIATILKRPASPLVCRGCGRILPPEHRFCGDCGTPVRSLRRCGACGAAQVTGSHCGSCGATLQG